MPSARTYETPPAASTPGLASREPGAAFHTVAAGPGKGRGAEDAVAAGPAPADAKRPAGVSRPSVSSDS